MRKLSPSPFSATVGIDKIFHSREKLAVFPEQRFIRPSESVDRPRLDLLVNRASIGDYIFERLRPDLRDASVLSPTQFRLALEEVRRSLLPLAKAHPGSAKIGGKLTRILEEESELLDLLQMYWSALLQG